MNILFIGTLPEPVTGQSVACQVFLDSLRKKHAVEVIDLSKRSFNQGFDSLGRLREVLGFIWQALSKSRTTDRIYFTISESISGNLKDMLIYLACFNKLPQMTIHLHGGAGMREILKPKNKLMRILNRFFLKKIGTIIILGERHRDMFNGIAHPGSIKIVPNFAENAIFINADVVYKKFNEIEPLRLLFLSNLLPGKGHIELVDAYKAIDNQLQKKIQIDFAGGFQSERKKSLFLESISEFPLLKYHGTVHGNDKINLFHHAHLFCLPTYYSYEGQPISILEAYASGCVVMTTDHSGILDIFTPLRNGYCVDKCSSSSIAQTLKAILNQPSALVDMALINISDAESFYRTDQFIEKLTTIIISSKTNNT